jgi:hypothetical protein
MQELGVALADVGGDQTAVAPDTVRLMHHRVADAQLTEVAQHTLGAAPGIVAAARLTDLGGVEFGLGDHRDATLGIEPSLRQRPDGDGRHAASRHRRGAAGATGVDAGKAGPAIDRLGPQAVLGHQLRQGLAAAGRLGHHQHASGKAGDEALEGAERVLGAAVDGQRRQPVAGRLGSLRGGRSGGRSCGGGGRQAHLGARPQQLEQGLGAEEDVARRQQGALRIAPEQLVARACVAPEGLGCPVHVVVEQHQRVVGQVVGEGRQLVEEQRQVVLDAGRRHAVADVAVDARAAGIALDALAVAAAKGGTGGVVERELAAGSRRTSLTG